MGEQTVAGVILTVDMVRRMEENKLFLSVRGRSVARNAMDVDPPYSFIIAVLDNDPRRHLSRSPLGYHIMA